MQYFSVISKKRMMSVHFQGKPFSITVIQVYAPTTDTEEAEVNQFYEDLHHLLELTHTHTHTHTKMFFSSKGTGMQKKEVKRYLE